MRACLRVGRQCQCNKPCRSQGLLLLLQSRAFAIKAMGGPTVGSGNTLRARLMSQGWLWPLCGYSASLKISLHFAWYTVTTLLPLFTKSAVFCLQSYVHCANTTITCGFGCLWQGAKIIDVFNKKLKCYLHQCLISGNLPKTFIITFLLFSSSFFN